MTQISQCFDQENFEGCAQYAKTWGEIFPEDKIYSQACFSIFLLAQGKSEEFICLADQLAPQLEISVVPELQSAYFKLLHLVKEEIRQEVLNYKKWGHCSLPTYECRRGWKIKCFMGAIGYTAGLFIVPFNPALGFSIISAAGGFILDGALGALDEQDERREKLADERPRNRACLLH